MANNRNNLQKMSNQVKLLFILFLEFQTKHNDRTNNFNRIVWGYYNLSTQI